METQKTIVNAGKGMREMTTAQYRKMLKDAGAVKVSIKTSPFTDQIAHVAVQFTSEGKPETVTGGSLFGAEFIASHQAVFDVLAIRPVWLSDRHQKLV